MLKGKKTYGVAVLIAIVVAAKYLNFLDENTYATLLGLLGAGGLTTLRMGMK